VFISRVALGETFQFPTIAMDDTFVDVTKLKVTQEEQTRKISQEKSALQEEVKSHKAEVSSVLNETASGTSYKYLDS